MQRLLAKRLWTAAGSFKPWFLKGHSAFWQLSTDSMLPLLSLSSAEKQEAQNQFGVERRGWREQALWLLLLTVGAEPHQATRGHSVLGWSLLPGCSFKHFQKLKEILLLRLGFWLLLRLKMFSFLGSAAVYQSSQGSQKPGAWIWTESQF